MHGFYCRVGSANAVWAEMWGLRLGIKLACQLKLQRVVFEMDFEVVLKMVHSGSTNNVFLRSLLQEILSLQHADWSTSVSHIYREANRCADLLANLGHSASFEWVLFDRASPSLGLLLADDARVVLYLGSSFV